MAKRVLIVDDAMIMRMRIKEIARDSGWEIAGEAANGEVGIALYRELRPDLMTLDIVMPKMDGVSVLRQIKQDHPAAKIVMVSAVDQRGKLTECIRLGAIDFIVKPFDKARLRSFFTKYLHDELPLPAASESGPHDTLNSAEKSL
jgi:two-component system chemotaxis response regulator CheY